MLEKINPGIFALLGVVVGSGTTILVNWFNNQQQINLDRKRWKREKLLEVYSNLIYYLFRYIQGFEEKAESKGNNFAESCRWLYLLTAYYPTESNDNFDEFRNKVRLFTDRGGELFGWDNVISLHNEIIEMARQDRRLNI